MRSLRLQSKIIKDLSGRQLGECLNHSYLLNMITGYLAAVSASQLLFATKLIELNGTGAKAFGIVKVFKAAAAIVS